MRNYVTLTVVLLGFPAHLVAAERPNIVLILTDDQRWDAMSCAGHPWLKTPHIDRLARHGVWFQNAFVTTSLCSPSRASILTGQYAHRHRVIDNYHPVPSELTFFPQHLQRSGYETAFIGKWHMGGDSDQPQRGFDHWVSFKGQGVYYPQAEQAKVKGRYVPQTSAPVLNVNGRHVPQRDYITDELTHYAVDWLERRSSSRKPFFLYLSHKAVHADFLPANRHAFRYEQQPFEQPTSWFEQPEEFHGVPMWVQNQRNSRHGVEFAYYGDLDLATYYRRYCETILAVDESVGQLLATLESIRMLDSTLIVLLGDNGFLFGEHGLIDKRCAYEPSMRIPLIVHYPHRLASGARVKELVANIDIAPTLLDAAGLEVPDHMDGNSFLALAEGKRTAWREHLLYEYFWEQNYPQTPTMHAVRGTRFKYIRYHGVWDTDELYDLQQDPGETCNLIDQPEYAELVSRMNRKLFEILQSSSGMELPLVPDRGTRFHHRKRTGHQGAEFPARFLRDPDAPGK
jgi:N-acetylglucosamine-6-sulfatase